MSTPPNLPFPDCHVDELRELFRQQGAEAVIAFILAHPDRSQRRQLFSLAHQVIGCAEGHGGNLDDYIVLMHAAFAEFLKQATEEKDPAEAAKRKDGANMLSYNFASTLAECWPEDPAPRLGHHFRAGLRAAERCLAWRRELNKPPFSFSLAWWAKGVHELSLANFAAAATSFAESAAQATLAARTDGRNPALVPNGDYLFVLAEGYRGLALARAADPAGAPLFAAACTAFEQTIAQFPGEHADDAQVGLAQLRCMKERLEKRLGAA